MFKICLRYSLFIGHFRFFSNFLQEFSIEKCTDLHATVGGVTTQGVAVRGGTSCAGHDELCVV